MVYLGHQVVWDMSTPAAVASWKWTEAEVHGGGDTLGPVAVAHLLFGTCHLEAGTEVIQPFPLLMAPQALQVLP